MTSKQTELINGLVSQLSEAERLFCEPVIEYLLDLGYIPQKQKKSAYVVSFVKRMRLIAKIEYGKKYETDPAPSLIFWLRYSAGGDYSQKFFAPIIMHLETYRKKHGVRMGEFDAARCCGSCRGDSRFYEYVWPDGTKDRWCGASAMPLTDLTAEDVPEIKKHIKNQDVFFEGLFAKDLEAIHEMKTGKYKIEDIINELLDGEAKENALDFAAWLRANKFGISATSNGISWKATFKGKTVCRILNMKNDWWRVENYPYNIPQKYDELTEKINELIVKENMQDVIWKHMTANKCRRCAPNFCSKISGENPGSFAGFTVKLFGREFVGLCKYNMYFDNPDKRAVECCKKICELKKQSIINNLAMNS